LSALYLEGTRRAHWLVETSKRKSCEYPRF